MDMEFTPTGRFDALAPGTASQPRTLAPADDPDFIAACIAAADASAEPREEAPRAEMSHGGRSRRDPLEEAAKFAAVGRRKAETRDEVAKVVAPEPPAEVPSQPIAESFVAAPIPAPVDRRADASELAEARRREAQAREDLQSLWEEFNHLKRRHDETTMELTAVTQREAQARTDLEKAVPLIVDHESTLGQLRRVVSERDQEIHELQRRLVAAEEARVTDAAAFLRQDDERTRKLDAALQSDAQARDQLAKAMSVIADHESAAEQLHLVISARDQEISARDQEINELRQRLLDAEEARVADAAAFLESLSKHQG